jgi:SAM-dependent methyltransferase
MLTPSVRELARRVGPFYRLVGLARYMRFRARLAVENRRYRARATESPPPLLRYRVHGAFEEEVYHHAGRVIADCVVAAWQRHVPAGDARVLDFGCGPGRVAVQVKERVPACRLSGSDIDPEAIAWAQRHLAHVGTFSVNDPSPPTRFADASFDVIYAVSVFTHLDEAAQLAWLHELGRLIAKGGLLVATVHGSPAHASCRPGELAGLQRHGFWFRVDRTGRLKLDGLPDSYQTTFHTRDYVERMWTRGFTLVEYAEGGLHGHQDIVVLRR